MSKNVILLKPKFYAPVSWWNTSMEEKMAVCNGCGSKDGIKVPNTIWGLNIKELCNIHDWMYKYGVTLADKLFADAMFRLNLTIWIDAQSGFIGSSLSILRHKRASTYYTAVAKWGNKAFWINKQPSNLMVITYKGEFR